jgi:hypothetical protein
MHEYKLTPALFSLVQRRSWIFGILFFVLATAGVTWIGIQENFPLPVFFIIVLLLLIVSFFGVLRGLRQQHKLWLSYRLILDDNSIKRTNSGKLLPDLTIQYSDISKITETPGVGLNVQASNPPRQIGVPVTLEGYSEFWRELAKRHRIDLMPKHPSQWMQFMPLLINLLTLVGFAVNFLSTNSYIIAGTGTMLFVIMLGNLVVIQQNKDTTRQAKQRAWLFLLPAFLIASRVLVAIFGH